VHGGDAQRVGARAVQRHDRGAQLAHGLRECLDGRRPRDRRAQVKRRARLGGGQVGVLDHAEHPAGG